MAAFDVGYAGQPFRGLCEDVPGRSVYPAADFRLEWGPVFHRGRLDGSARVLVLGQDPAQHETIARRILVGEAGHRIQGFLAKLGIDRSYVMVNTYVYSVFGQGRGNKHRTNKRIAAYRNRWLSALFDSGGIDAVVALGSLADSAWETWKETPEGQAVSPAYRKITHPTQPQASGGGGAATRAMLQNWNAALQDLHPLPNRDKARPLRLYGDAFEPADKKPIPSEDLPAGMPDWMRLNDGWADRPGTGLRERATIEVRVPREFLP
ncbi:MAG TPA: uracil-DNA glycosylase family protein [Gaiellaceae bacterium]|nr:uracil-DNA glycosylase family protein [Gaiellaceae bacterium]